MTNPSRQRLFRHGLMVMAASLITVAISARAAISNGTLNTNAVDAEQQRILDFYRAEQSYQQKLKVGKERYNRKQIERAKVIGAMSSELESRQQNVVIPPVSATVGQSDEPASWFWPSLAVPALVVGLIGYGQYRSRPRALETTARSG